MFKIENQAIEFIISSWSVFDINVHSDVVYDKSDCGIYGDDSLADIQRVGKFMEKIRAISSIESEQANLLSDLELNLWNQVHIFSGDVIPDESGLRS